MALLDTKFHGLDELQNETINTLFNNIKIFASPAKHPDHQQIDDRWLDDAYAATAGMVQSSGLRKEYVYSLLKEHLNTLNSDIYNLKAANFYLDYTFGKREGCLSMLKQLLADRFEV